MLEYILDFFNTAVHYVRTATVWDVLEVSLVAYLLYRLMKFIHKTSVERVIKGIMILVLVTQLSEWANLNVINFILRNTLQIGLVALIIMFQPELRRVLEQVGGANLQQIFEREAVLTDIRQMIREVVDACSSMSWARSGALIVFERSISTRNHVTASTSLDAQVTSELIKSIFFKNAPLHDGAMLISGARMVAAGCVLPLSENEALSKELGTRHRAGIGITEQTDAVVVMVSEETGTISVAMKGELRRGLSPETLENLLVQELITKSEEKTIKKKVIPFWKGKQQ